MDQSIDRAQCASTIPLTRPNRLEEQQRGLSPTFIAIFSCLSNVIESFCLFSPHMHLGRLLFFPLSKHQDSGILRFPILSQELVFAQRWVITLFFCLRRLTPLAISIFIRQSP